MVGGWGGRRGTMKGKGESGEGKGGLFTLSGTDSETFAGNDNFTGLL